MRVIYEYPEDARNGDVFVVDLVDVSPTTVTIHMERYVPKPDPRVERYEDAVDIADALVEELLQGDTPATPKGYLLVQAYKAARR